MVKKRNWSIISPSHLRLDKNWPSYVWTTVRSYDWDVISGRHVGWSELKGSNVSATTEITLMHLNRGSSRWSDQMLNQTSSCG